MTTFIQVFYVFFSAIIQSLAISNEFLLFGSPLLGLFALVPLYIAISYCKSFRAAGLMLSIQFTVVHLLSSFWLAFFKDFAVLTLGATVAYYTVLGFFLGQLLFIPFWITKKNKLQEIASFTYRTPIATWNIPFRILFFASIWTLYEWYKSYGFLGYPWVTIIMTTWKWSHITQIVSITGTWGLSFLFALFNAVIAEGILCAFYIVPKKVKQYVSNKEKQIKFSLLPSYTWTALFCTTLFLCTLIQGSYQIHKERIPIKKLDTVIVQTNTDSWLTRNDEEAIKIGQELTTDAITKYGKTPDIVVWSEALLSMPYPHAYTYYQSYPKDAPLTEFIAKTNADFIIGGPTEINQEEYLTTGIRQYNNSAQYYDSNGYWRGFYGKIHLVPMAEIIPYADSEFVQRFMKAVVGFSNGWTQGESYTVFDVPIDNEENVTISTPICFEDAFPHICRELFFQGSEAFYNITNDSWSKTDSAEIQHFVIASFRSQEFRTTLLRSTNSGFSVVLDPTGKIIYSLPLFEATSGGFDVPIFEREITLYALLGDWLPKLLLTIMLLIYFCAYIFYKKDTRKNTEYEQSDAFKRLV